MPLEGCVLVCIAVAGAAACTPDEHDQRIAVDQVQQLSKVPGAIGVAITVAEKRGTRTQRILIKDGQISPVESLPKAVAHTRSGNTKPNEASKYIQDPRYELVGAYDVSADKNLVAAVAMPKGNWDAIERLCVILDTKSGKPRAVLEAPPRATFHSVAWSPNSDYLATLLQETRPDTSALDFLASLFGHRSYSYRYVLRVTDTSGKVVGEGDLTLWHGSSYADIVWVGS